MQFVIVVSKTCLKRPLTKKIKTVFEDRLSFNAGQKYCRMLQREHSAILLTFIKLPVVINMFVLSIFECPLKTGFTVFTCDPHLLFRFINVIFQEATYNEFRLVHLIYGPRREKTCLRGFGQSEFQTSLYSYRD